MFDTDHHRYSSATELPAALPCEGKRPAKAFDHDEPDVVARLEMLDDVIFAAIEGDENALEMAADTWHAALAALGPATVDESRRQYLRRAQSVWEKLRHQPGRPAAKLFAAIEIISLLAGGDS